MSHSHGHTKGYRTTRTYSSWRGMFKRCTNSKNDNYAFYGGRGIKVCPRWYKFENFLADMGEVPEGMTLDRRDTNGDYTPGNCRWVNAREQAENRRNNVHVTLDGVQMTLTAAARKLGISQPLANWRLRKGWPIEKVLSPDVRKWQRVVR